MEKYLMKNVSKKELVIFILLILKNFKNSKEYSL